MFSNPTKLFLLDGFGALLSAFMLGVVLVKFESFFGIPKTTLYLLAFFPCLFALYDLYCYKTNFPNPAKYLKAIAIMNVSYCILSIVLTVLHVDLINIFGWIYIFGEILIVLGVAYLEYSTASKLAAYN